MPTTYDEESPLVRGENPAPARGAEPQFRDRPQKLNDRTSFFEIIIQTLGPVLYLLDAIILVCLGVCYYKPGFRCNDHWRGLWILIGTCGAAMAGSVARVNERMGFRPAFLVETIFTCLTVAWVLVGVGMVVPRVEDQCQTPVYYMQGVLTTLSFGTISLISFGAVISLIPQMCRVWFH